MIVANPHLDDFFYIPLKNLFVKRDYRMKYKEKLNEFSGMAASRSTIFLNIAFLDKLLGTIELYIWKKIHNIQTPICWNINSESIFEFCWTGIRYGFYPTKNKNRHIHLSHYFNATDKLALIFKRLGKENTIILNNDNDITNNYLYKKYFGENYKFKIFSFTSDSNKFFDKKQNRLNKVLTFGTIHLIEELRKEKKIFYKDSFSRLINDFPTGTFHDERLMLSKINHNMLIKYFYFWGIDDFDSNELFSLNLNDELNRYKYFIVGGENSGAIPIGLLDGISAGSIPIVHSSNLNLIKKICDKFEVYKDKDDLINLLNSLNV